MVVLLKQVGIKACTRDKLNTCETSASTDEQVPGQLICWLIIPKCYSKFCKRGVVFLPVVCKYSNVSLEGVANRAKNVFG